MGYSALSKYRSELLGFAMLSVMLFHAFDLDLRLDFFNWLRSVGFGGVDIFILLSAMGLSQSLQKREQRLGDFYRRRFRRILPAYYIVMLPYTLLCIRRQTASLATLLLNSTLLSYWVKAEGGFNWYICGISLFYLLTPLCFRLLQKSRRPELLTLLGALLGLLLSRLLMALDQWSYLDVAYRIPVYCIGLLLGFWVTEERKIAKKDALLWTGLFLCGLLYLLPVYRLDSTIFYAPLCHLFLFTTVPLCLALCALFSWLPWKRPLRLLRLVGESSLEIYLLNVTMFAEVEFLRRYIDTGPYVYWFISFSLNLALGLLLHRVLARLTKGGLRAKTPAKMQKQ